MFLNESTYYSTNNKSFEQIISESNDLFNGYDKLKIKMMRLEHAAIVNNDRTLLEEGDKNFLQKAWDFIKRIFEAIMNFIKKIFNAVKEFFAKLFGKDDKTKKEELKKVNPAEVKQIAKDIESGKIDSVPNKEFKSANTAMYTNTYDAEADKRTPVSKAGNFRYYSNMDKLYDYIASKMVTDANKLQMTIDVNNDDDINPLKDLLSGAEEKESAFKDIPDSIIQTSIIAMINGSNQMNQAFYKALTTARKATENAYTKAQVSYKKENKEEMDAAKKRLETIKGYLTDMITLFKKVVYSAKRITDESARLNKIALANRKKLANGNSTYSKKASFESYGVLDMF